MNATIQSTRCNTRGRVGQNAVGEKVEHGFRNPGQQKRTHETRTRARRREDQDAWTSRQVMNRVDALDPVEAPVLYPQSKSSRRDFAVSLSLYLFCSASILKALPVAAVESASPTDIKTFVSKSMGFQFSYPSSFVVAFDRTDSYGPRNVPADQDVALTSVGSYSKSFLTVTVFAKRVGSNEPLGVARKDFFYEGVIRPVVDSPTTIGFSLTSESVSGEGEDAYYDFEFVHSVCRGETIEGKAGTLRCIGNFGQDLPVQSRIVLGRSIVRDGVLLTVMGSIRTERGDVEGAMIQERRSVQRIVETFGSVR